MVTVHTFGDSILDCGHYNAHGLHPAGLLVRNDDRLFPEFRGHDLASRGPARLDHRAVDGARVNGLASQLRGATFAPDSIILVTVGGNDLLGGLAVDAGPSDVPAGTSRSAVSCGKRPPSDAPAGTSRSAVSFGKRPPGLARFRDRLSAFLDRLPRGRVLLGNVYDPTFGDDSRNFLPVDPALPRRNLARMNALLADLAARHGALVDVHGHFLHHGDPSWFTSTIEPSLVGASELRRVFLDAALPLLGHASGMAPDGLRR